jgi:hypothetical protein
VRYCESLECSGLDPCEACAQVRRAILMRAVMETGLNKAISDEVMYVLKNSGLDKRVSEALEKAGTRPVVEKFFRAYAEAFDLAVTEIRKAQESLAQKRLEEKEARDREVKGASKEKEGREKTRAGGAKHTSPLRGLAQTKNKALANSNGEASKDVVGEIPTDKNNQHHTKGEST